MINSSLARFRGVELDLLLYPVGGPTRNPKLAELFAAVKLICSGALVKEENWQEVIDHHRHSIGKNMPLLYPVWSISNFTQIAPSSNAAPRQGHAGMLKFVE